jgi:hypothetical protein
MIEAPQIITREMPEKVGGLLICGSNFAGSTPQPEAPFPPYADYFTDEPNNFNNRLTLWFDWWGLPLKEKGGTPTGLNRAISATNLFYDHSKTYELRSPLEMESAFKRLMMIVERLNISGLLIASEKLFIFAQQAFGLPATGAKPFGKFWMYFGATASLDIALCPHPTSHQTTQNVTSAGAEMREWISRVLEKQTKKRLALGGVYARL